MADVIYVRAVGLRLAAFWLGALVAAAYFPLLFLVRVIDEGLGPVALIVELALLFTVGVFIRRLNLSLAWPVLGLAIAFVVSAIVTFIILISIYGWSGG